MLGNKLELHSCRNCRRTQFELDTVVVVVVVVVVTLSESAYKTTTEMLVNSYGVRAWYG